MSANSPSLLIDFKFATSSRKAKKERSPFLNSWSYVLNNNNYIDQEREITNNATMIVGLKYNSDVGTDPGGKTSSLQQVDVKKDQPGLFIPLGGQ